MVRTPRVYCDGSTEFSQINIGEYSFDIYWQLVFVFFVLFLGFYFYFRYPKKKFSFIASRFSIFEFEFLDDQLDELYRSEQSVMSLTGMFSAICVFISCLGLFGLASFTTEQRTKEIGVRKVLGSSSWQIIVLLSKSILGLVLAGAVVASIASFFAITEWLNSFAYRDSINPLFFITATVLAMAVAFATVAMQSYRTASSNPVQALRYE